MSWADQIQHKIFVAIQISNLFSKVSNEQKKWNGRQFEDLAEGKLVTQNEGLFFPRKVISCCSTENINFMVIIMLKLMRKVYDTWTKQHFDLNDGTRSDFSATKVDSNSLFKLPSQAFQLQTVKLNKLQRPLLKASMQRKFHKSPNCCFLC